MNIKIIQLKFSKIWLNGYNLNFRKIISIQPWKYNFAHA